MKFLKLQVTNVIYARNIKKKKIFRTSLQSAFKSTSKYLLKSCSRKNLKNKPHQWAFAVDDSLKNKINLLFQTGKFTLKYKNKKTLIFVFEANSTTSSIIALFCIFHHCTMSSNPKKNPISNVCLAGCTITSKTKINVF